MKEYIPERGDLVWLTFNPQAGHEPAGRRLALVLSPKGYNAKTSLSLVCPITSQVKGYPFEIAIPQGVPIQGVILSDQIRSLDWRARQAEWVGSLPGETIEKVLERLKTLLGLD
jgi:mRNA interferase MazF